MQPIAQEALVMRLTPVLVLVLFAGCAEGSDEELAAEVAPPTEPAPAPPAQGCPEGRTCVAVNASEPEARVAEVFATATPGTVIELGRGVFTLTNTLALAGDEVVVRGAGRDETVLDFRGQRAGSEGVLVENARDVTLESFTVTDTRGNGVKVLEGDGVTMRDLGVRWTAEDASSHGAYGLYPVRSKRVLVERCAVSGASDAGIYVGQSEGAVVRRNLATGNVAGIEIENSFDVDVHENEAVGNSGGILVVDLPWVPRTGGRTIRVHGNTIARNDVANFSPRGSFVESLPRGIGLLVMAIRDVEVHSNTIRDNPSVNVAIASFLATGNDVSSERYDPYPARVFVHDNDIGGGGDAPDTTLPIGLALAGRVPGVVPSIVYDGIVGGRGPNPHQICVRANGAATFVDLRLGDRSGAPSFDPAPYDCVLPPVVPRTGIP